MTTPSTAEAATIAALLTPLAPGAIAVLGLAGPRTDEILARILRTPGGDPLPSPRERRPTFCSMVEGDAVLDDALVVRLASGRAARAEIHTHGGVRIAQRVLLLLERRGATIVDSAEYEGRRRAGPAGPAADVEREVDRALRSAGSRRLAAWLLAQRSLLPAFLQRPAACTGRRRTAFLRRSRVAIRLLRGLQIALVGPPNAGKSSLANRLIGRDRAITSSRPGTTRDWIAETALIDGWPVTLTDTAGLRPTRCAIEAEAIRRAGARARAADAVLIVLDAATPPPAQRRAAEAILPLLPEGHPRLIVANKCDLPGAAPAPGLAPCPVSALTGAGLPDLEARLAARLGLNLLDASKPTAFLEHQIDSAERV